MKRKDFLFILEIWRTNKQLLNDSCKIEYKIQI